MDFATIPCRKCPQCGLYHDVTVLTCRCGKPLVNVPAAEYAGKVPPELRGEIKSDIVFYVQKCMSCGFDNYTHDPRKPVMICHSCGTHRIQRVVPVRFEEKTAEPKEPAPAAEKPAELPVEVPPVVDAGEAVSWEALLGDIADDPQQPAPQPEVQKPIAPKASRITLSALRYGTYSFTVDGEKDSLPYMLGRDANQSDFLIQDGRVGRNHCSLDLQDGEWVVIDNRSTNGTLVNQQIVYRCLLHTGDELMLGHDPDSMAFRILVEA